MYDISDLEFKVKAGAKFLDESKPNWFLIFSGSRLTNFNAADSYNDVLGKLFGSFHVGVNLLELTTEKLFLYGFDLSFDFILNYEGDAWCDLTNLWQEEIVDRQENGIPA